MEASRFDRFSQRVAGRLLSRRSALRVGSGGVMATLLAAAGGRVAAQGTPASGTPTAGPGGQADNNATLFVQTATGGTVAANPTAGTPVSSKKLAGPHGAFVVTLHGHSGETIAFSDRPARQFGEVATPQFFTSMGFTAANPPNAALVADTPQQAGAVYLVELMTPHYDASSHTLTYEANLLHQYPNAKGSGLMPLATKAQTTPPAASFTNASLFIDDCPDADPLNCYADCSGNAVGNLGNHGMCWSWSAFQCQPCGIGWDGAASQCNQQFSACGGHCFSDWGDQCGDGI